ncbi:MAG: alpha/beta hydrolase [Rhodospirillales bacterium]|nr:alpha/beta hydrolase [Alphaproteobacteria bacterium]USO04063.1 MAG: alpha/beta hydrolase [Rhodospirillales bacterium]
MTIRYLQSSGGNKLAYIHIEGDKASLPTVVFLGGYRSDMEGTKALYLEGACRARGQAFIRFDYSGHGKSGGKFEDGTIGSWTQDTLDILDRVSEGPLILVGSSMGGWIAFLCALARPLRVKGLVGIAAAPDFTTWIEADISAGHKADLEEKGYFEVPSEYSDAPYIFTKALLEEGRSNTLLDRGIPLDIPIRLFQGKKDTSVPWEVARRIKDAVTGEDVAITWVEDGDHSLSRAEDLPRIRALIDEIEIKIQQA